MKVKDFMIQDVISVHKETTVKELLKIFVEHHIGGVPVVNDENELLGIISDGDVIRYLSPKEQAVHDLFYTVYIEEGETEQDVLAEKTNHLAADMMHRKRIYTVKEDDDFEYAIRLLSKHHFKKLPVVDESNKLIGVISRGDIIHNLSKMIISK